MNRCPLGLLAHPRRSLPLIGINHVGGNKERVRVLASCLSEHGQLRDVITLFTLTMPSRNAALQLCLVLGGFTASQPHALRPGSQLNIWVMSAEMVGAVELDAQGHEFGTVCDRIGYVI